MYSMTCPQLPESEAMTPRCATSTVSQAVGRNKGNAMFRKRIGRKRNGIVASVGPGRSQSSRPGLKDHNLRIEQNWKSWRAGVIVASSSGCL